MTKTYYNIYDNFPPSKVCSIGEPFKTLKDCPADDIRYLFTLEINEKGKPRIFKYEPPKEPIKSYYVFCESTSESYGTLEDALEAQEFYQKERKKSFIKCFDETGKEYPIEKEE